MFTLQALWQLLWVIPGNAPSFQNPTIVSSENENFSVDIMKHKARVGASELLGQVCFHWDNLSSLPHQTEMVHNFLVISLKTFLLYSSFCYSCFVLTVEK